jgi:putative redox protein
MKEAINVRWAGDMAFEAGVSGHTVLMDAREEVGGHDQGPRPKALMMASLAGCTGMDVISILKKMKVEPESLNIRIEGTLTEEHPKKYTAMHVIYEFRGDLPEDKLHRAVELSQDKYCGVSATLRDAFPVTWEIKIL